MQWVASFRLAAPPTALRTCSAIFLLSVILIPPILSQIIVSDELNILLRQPGAYLGPAEHRSFS